MKNSRCKRLMGGMGSLRRGLCLLLLAGLLTGLAGCTRAFWRRGADREVNDILAEKDKYAQWRIAQYHVYPDPRARFGDPTNPDRPPMPPDDDATYNLSPHPQHPGKAGVASVWGTAYLEMIKAWDAQNRAERANAKDNKDQQGAPAQQPAAGADASRSGPLQTMFNITLAPPQQGLLLTLDQTVELGLVNSREYQSFREDLYLAALPVTLQRFSFAWQWTAIENAFRQWAGLHSSAGHQNNWTLNSTVGVSKLFSTGALLTAAFANNTVFNFLGTGPSLISVSSINLDLVQPFLRGGGRAVTLEPLTQVERNLVYNIRAYARFREQFFVSVALGTTLPSNLPSAANIGGGSTGSPISLLASLGIASTDVAGQFRGYLPTLFREFDWAVDTKYVRDLERALVLFEGFQEGGQLAPLQVAQVRSTLLNARNSVLKDVQDKTNALDQFKLQLGIPANTPLVLDDSPGRPITSLLDRYYEVLAESNAAYKRIEEQGQLPAAKLRPFLLQMYTADPLVRGTAFQKKVSPSWQAWSTAGAKDLAARLQQLGAERRKLLDLKTDVEMKGQKLSDDAARRLREADFESDLAELEKMLRRYEGRPWEKLPKEAQRLEEQATLFRLVSYSAGIVLVWARNERFDRVGEQWPTLPKSILCDFDLLDADVDQAQAVAVQYALTNRVDLMNNRAQVVDAWRQLRVTANALMGVFNVAYHMDSRTPALGSNPLAFSPSGTNQQLILNAQLPLVRVAERNNYRTAVINYQRARRNLLNLEDNIAAQVRFDVRQLHLFAANYKIQQKVVELFYTQVENALEVIVAPVDPDSLKQTGTAGQAAAAALTNQYLTALNGLNGAQTKMYDLWLSFLATRMELFLDLERLPLDLRGVWTDESGNPADDPHSAAGGCALGQPLPCDERGAATLGSAALGRPFGGDERRGGEPLPAPRILPPATGPALE